MTRHSHPTIDKAATVRPHDPLQRIALAMAAVLAFLGSLYLLGPGFGLVLLFLTVALLIFVSWSWPVTIVIVLLIVGYLIGKRYVRLAREHVETRERERELDKEIPF